MFEEQQPIRERRVDPRRLAREHHRPGGVVVGDLDLAGERSGLTDRDRAQVVLVHGVRA